VHLWIEIVARELAMLVTLFALGIGPASFLGRRFDAAARLAIAPVFGLCVATCVFTTLIWFTAARHTFWLLPVIAAVSIVLALRRSITPPDERDDSRGRWAALRRLRARDALSLAIVCIVVAAPLSYTLHERNSVGPTGFLIMDADGYTLTADGMEQLSIRQAQRPAPESSSFVHKEWHFYASGNSTINASPLAANLDLLIGLHATDTQSLFLIAFLLTDALGAFAAVRYFAPKPSWAAPLAGVLFAGPLFLQLMADGSQSATCGMAVMAPLATVGAEVLREQRFANLALFALLVSGLMALYPLYLPVIILAVVVVLVTIAILNWLRDRLSWHAVRRAALLGAIVVGLAIAFDVVGATRAVPFWLETLGGEDLANKPEYHLPLSVLPSWVLQTRQFYLLQVSQLPFLPAMSQSPIGELIDGTILPAVFVAVIVFGLWRNRYGLVLAAIVVVFAAVAEYGSLAHGCSYCVDRDTLPSAPPTIVLLILGIVALARGKHKWMRWTAIALAAIAVVAVGEQTKTERQLFAAESYFLGGQERALASELPPHPGAVDMEGFGENGELDLAIGEQPLVYSLLYEHSHGEVSMPNEYDDNRALAYIGGPNPRDPELIPDYRYVLTRLGGVETGRRVIARVGPLALEERTGPLDATITSGVAVPMVRQDARGLPSVVGPLHLLLLGGGSAPAWILLRFQTLAPAGAPPQPGVRAHATEHELTVCVRATGTAPVRRAALNMTGRLYAGGVPAEKFGLSEPPRGITLLTMRAVSHCTP
jgi:hypothetical protein